MTLVVRASHRREWDDPTYEAAALRVLGLFGVIAPHVGRIPIVHSETLVGSSSTSDRYLSGMCATGRHGRCTGIVSTTSRHGGKVNAHRCTCAVCNHLEVL